jgi:hypothetical protein
MIINKYNIIQYYNTKCNAMCSFGHPTRKEKKKRREKKERKKRITRV